MSLFIDVKDQSRLNPFFVVLPDLVPKFNGHVANGVLEKRGFALRLLAVQLS